MSVITDYVWIKLATAKEDVFAKIFYCPTLQGRFRRGHPCQLIPSVDLSANKIRLFLVAKAGSKPKLPALETFKDMEPLAEEATLGSAGVTSKSWLVAVPSTPSGSNGGRDEAEASAAFWTLAHAAFPGATLEWVQRTLLDGVRPISNRFFSPATFPRLRWGELRLSLPHWCPKSRLHPQRASRT